MLLIRPLVGNDNVVAAPSDVVRPLPPVTRALEFNPTIVVIDPLIIKPLVLVMTIL